MAGIIRITMFKVPAKENQLKVLELYKTLTATATKVRTFPMLLLFDAIPFNQRVQSRS